MVSDLEARVKCFKCCKKKRRSDPAGVGGPNLGECSVRTQTLAEGSLMNFGPCLAGVSDHLGAAPDPSGLMVRKEADGSG